MANYVKSYGSTAAIAYDDEKNVSAVNKDSDSTSKKGVSVVTSDTPSPNVSTQLRSLGNRSNVYTIRQN